MWSLAIIYLPCRTHQVLVIDVSTKDVILAETWFNGQSAVVATDQLSDPFLIVTDHTKRQKTDTPGSSSPSSNIYTSNSERYKLPGNSSAPSQHKQTNNAADNFSSVGSSSSNLSRAGSHTNTFGSNPMFASKNNDSEFEAFKMPESLNPH